MLGEQVLMDRKPFWSNLWLVFKGHFFFNADSISLIKCGLVMSIQLPTYPDPGAFRAGDRHVKKNKYTFNFFLPIPLDEAQLTKEEFGLLENIPVTTEVKDYCL